MADLSILIPAKNEEFLKKTVEDILSNIEGDTEVIVVLDGYEIALPELPNNPKVRVLINEESKGQRAATNQACQLSGAKYVMKVDAHCAFDKGFDVKMMSEMHDNWTMLPVMRNLHAFNWVCPDGHTRYQSPSGVCTECGKETKKDVVWIPKTNPQSTSYCFDQEPHFQYFNAFKKHPDYKKSLEETGLTESMSIQGSCFMMTRDKYWELNICDESFGSWGSQGIEVACKTWLSGGRVVVNHKTWYAHMFRTQGGDFSFPYQNPNNKVQQAKKTARELFFDNKWDKQIYPLSWLVEKFWPVPGWTDESLAKIKSWPLQNKPETPKPSVGILYYTDNMLDEKVMRVCQKQLKKGAREKKIDKIVSVSLKPVDLGRNIVLPLERGYLTMFKQILTGLEALDTDIVYFTEHDVLYHPSHFDFIPPDRNIWYYNSNCWFLRLTDGFAIHYTARSLSGLCVYRDIAIKHYKERIAMTEREGFSYRMGFEPMTHLRIKWANVYGAGFFKSSSPNIDIKHGRNLTSARWSIDKFRNKPTDWKEADIDTIPGWDNVRKLLR